MKRRTSELRTTRVHKDLKPENILYHEEYGAAIADFGHAGTGSKSGLQPVARGTPGYHPPEAVVPGTKNGDYSDADRYALGHVLFNVLSGNEYLSAEQSGAALGWS